MSTLTIVLFVIVMQFLTRVERLIDRDHHD